MPHVQTNRPVPAWATAFVRHGRRSLLLLPVVVGIVVYAEGCRPVGPVATRPQIDALARTAYTLPDGRRVSYLHAGDPTLPRVIYVHGTPGDAEAWADYLVRPVPGLEAISVDRPGFGQSDAGRVMASIKEQADALAPLLVERNGKWPIVVGHSLGGPIACRLAADYPDRVGGLVIAAGSEDPAQERVPWYQHVGDWTLVAWALPSALRTCNRELIPLKGELDALAPRLAEIRCPVTVVHGTADPLVPYANADYLLARLPNAADVRLVRLEGVNHFLPWNSPQVIRSAVTDLAARPAATRPTTRQATAPTTLP